MKKIIFISCFILVNFLILTAQEKIDITKRPEPLAAKEFVFPEFKQTTLSNGLKVFIVEDHEQPTVLIQLLIPGGKSMDGSKPGLATITSDLLTKGAGKRTALYIAHKLDSMGASIGANTDLDYSSVYASCLTKHLPLVLEIFSDVLIKPTFPEDEFEKLQPQLYSSIKEEKSNPTTLAGRLARKIFYGETHPYALRMTEESIKQIKVKDVKEFYKTWFYPNEASIVVIGDVSEKDILKKLEKAIGGWKKGKTPEIMIPKPKPEPIGVYFVNRPSAVQSTVMLVTKGLPAADLDFETLEVGSEMIGAGFAGRLFRTLREKYSYTYTPFGRLTQNKYMNIFVCGADVRNSVTDSAIKVIQEQLRLICSEPASDEELGRLKSYLVGEYLMAFEKSSFLGSLIQGSDFSNIPFERVKTYAQRISALNSYDLLKITEKFLKPENAYIIVVGSPEVKSKLEQFGKVYEYDLDLNPLSGEKAKMEKVPLSPDELIEKYVEALGGQQALDNVQTMVNEGKASLTAQGREMNGTIIQKFKTPNKEYLAADIGVLKQTMWVDGTSAWVNAMGAMQKLDGKELDKMISDATLFNETKLIKRGFKCTVLGKQNGIILMKAVSPAGVESTYYYDAETYLIKKAETIEDTPQGPMPVTEYFKDYAKFDGIMMPGSVETVNPMFTIKVECKYKFNVPVDDGEFAPPKE